MTVTIKPMNGSRRLFVVNNKTVELDDFTWRFWSAPTMNELKAWVGYFKGLKRHAK